MSRPGWSADFIQTSIAKPDFDVFARRPMLVFRSTPEVSWALSGNGLIRSVRRALLVVLGSVLILIVVLGFQLDFEGLDDFQTAARGQTREAVCDV